MELNKSNCSKSIVSTPNNKFISFCRDNTFYNDLLNLFNTNEFKNIKDKYLSDKTSDKTALIYILLLLYIHTKKFHNNENENEYYLYIIHTLMLNSDTRNILIKHFLNLFNKSDKLLIN